MGCCSKKLWIICLSASGVVLLALGLAFGVSGVFDKLINENVDKDVQLKAGSLVYKEWIKPSVPIYMKYFVFNVTNPNEVMEGLEIPNVTQIGPYSYRELRSNEVLNWSSDQSIVTFMPNRKFIFDPETSCDGCDDKNDTFVTVNIPLLTLALKLKNIDLQNYSTCLPAVQMLANAYQVRLFQSKSVYDLLWGYTDPLLNTIVNVQSDACPRNSSKGVSPFVQLQGNNTYEGIIAMNTGQKDISKLEQFIMWRGQTHLTWWSDKYANMINGTDGTQFAPRVLENDKLYVFSPDVCRSMYLTYEKTVTVKNIKLYRFIAPDKGYLSGDIYPPNKGFCVPPRCLPTGLLNVSLCQPMNPPVVVSPPHFYQGNKSLLNTVNGLDPVKSAHGTHLDVEPITGIVMQAAKRVQLNVALESVNTINQTTGKFKPVFLPVMFAAESALITDKKAEEFRSKVYGALRLLDIGQYALLGIGIVCILLAAVIFVYHKKTSDNYDCTDEEKKPLVMS
ncbi:the CD36 [Porites harrisoni]